MFRSIPRPKTRWSPARTRCWKKSPMVPTKCLSCCRRTFQTPTGADEVFVVLSSDIPNPDEWKLHLHIVEHDKFGATYKVKAAGQEGVQIAWLCNVMHTVFGGEHPTDIYIHSISTKRP